MEYCFCEYISLPFVLQAGAARAPCVRFLPLQGLWLSLSSCYILQHMTRTLLHSSLELVRHTLALSLVDSFLKI